MKTTLCKRRWKEKHQHFCRRSFLLAKMLFLISIDEECCCFFSILANCEERKTPELLECDSFLPHLLLVESPHTSAAWGKWEHYTNDIEKAVGRGGYCVFHSSTERSAEHDHAGQLTALMQCRACWCAIRQTWRIPITSAEGSRSLQRSREGTQEKKKEETQLEEASRRHFWQIWLERGRFSASLREKAETGGQTFYFISERTTSTNIFEQPELHLICDTEYL